MEHPISSKIQAVTIATNDPEFLYGFYQQAFNLPAMKWEGKEHVGVRFREVAFNDVSPLLCSGETS